MGPHGNSTGLRARWAALGVAALTLLPFVPGIVSGGTFFYRDFGSQFLPERLYALEGLAHGELRYWNPYSHEGEPTWPLPLGYPIDLLQALAPSAQGVTALIAFHVPLAALAFWLLARALGRPPLSAATGALVYAWGGFTLSTLNLYVYAQAAAWAPLCVWACLKAGTARGKTRLAGVAALAITFSTLGVEVVAQAVVVGALLACLQGPGGRAARMVGLATTGALALGLCAYVILPTLGLLQGSERATGLATTGYSLHPVSLLQVLLGNLHSDLNDPLNWFWGQPFFPSPPYFLSLYLGPLALGLAVLGIRRDAAGRALGLLCLACAAIALGKYVGLDVIMNALPGGRALRSPVKAFFTVQLGTALLAASGAQALVEHRDRSWHWAAGGWLACALLLVGGGLTIAKLPTVRETLTAPLMEPTVSLADRLAMAERLSADAVRGGLLVLAAGLLAAAVVAGRLRPVRAAVGVALLLGADLLRTGAGLNPMVPARLLEPSSESRQLAEGLRAAEARVFVCESDLARVLNSQPLSYAARLFVYVDAMAAWLNVPQRVPTAMAPNATGFAPRTFGFAPETIVCAAFKEWPEALLQTGITHVIAPAPLAATGLRLEQVVRLPRSGNVSLALHAVEGALPWIGLSEAGRASMRTNAAGFVSVAVESRRGTVVTVRERAARGWRTRIDGRAAPLAPGQRHLVLAVPAGEHVLEFEYDPPGLRAGVTISLLSVTALAVLLLRDRRRPALV